jgi:ectoine hydroxylase-related dioxygenase (phytanoyl-CoA dioxygenase family)
VIHDYTLSQEQIDAYKRDGHVAIRSLVPPEEMSRLRPRVQQLVREGTTNVASLDERDTYGRAFLQVWDLNKKNKEVRDFVYARCFAKIAAELMGVAAVRLYFDQALFKEPGGGFTPWHQDHVYWPIDTDNMTTMWLPLVDIPIEVGSLEFVSGSHLGNYRDYVMISDESEATYRHLVNDQQLPVSTHGGMSLGDATFHAGWTLHRAPGNSSSKTREIFTIIFFEDGARLVSEVQPSQQGDIDLYFSNASPGDLVNDEEMPVLYSADP